MIPIRYNVRSLIVRKTTTIATAVGIALVIWVLSSALMLAAGVRKTLAISGQHDVAIVMRKGSDAELGSVIDAAEVSKVLGAPGVKRDEKGKPVGAGEIVVVAAMEKLGAAGVSNVQIRGVTEDVMKFRPEVRIVAGAPPKPGTDEVMIGKRLRGRFRGLDINQTFELRKNRPARVVGVFEAQGSSYESEVWVDLDTLRAAYAREGMVSSVRVKLENAEAFEGFRGAMEGDKRLGYQALRERKYYEKLSEITSIFINVVGTLVAVFCAVAAAIGAMITMYAAVSNREREIGTLRALGFSRGSILFSFLFESVVLALMGGATGAIASLAMGFVHLSVMNFQSWSELVFRFEPTPGIVLSSLAFAGVLGVLGGFFPALRASQVSPIEAMRG
jgi:putative ABC transport system permease protein